VFFTMKNDHNKAQNKAPRPSLYGVHAVREAWLNPGRRVQALYATSDAAKSFEPVLAEARQKGLKRPAPSVVQKEAIEKMLQKGAVHQGLALACPPLEDVFIQDMIIRAQSQENTLLLMLDQVTDPHNVGAILRSACALGAHGVIMQRKHAPTLEGVLAKTACGAIEHIPVAYETNLSRALEELKDGGFFAYGLDERGDTDIAACNASGKTVLVLGAEGPGMRRLVREHCDALVRLPTSGPIASLNVSNAAAVALYALIKK
jgi:23S rRNA (guanosine2251-2'-O)-methyltransferase